jgi:hemolysin III
MKLFQKCTHQHDDCTHEWYPKEELAITHFIGAGLGIAALVIMVTEASEYQSARAIVGVTIFGVSLLLTYLASAIFHVVPVRMKKPFRTIDHMCIYLLIAGTYTPFTLVPLYGVWGWSLFGVMWGLAAVGIVLKIKFTDRLEWLSTLTYVLMGWMALIAIVPLVHNLPAMALVWLVLGGAAYTLGVFFFLLETVPFAHTMWHLFVLAGSICHFFAVLFYIAR